MVLLSIAANMFVIAVVLVLALGLAAFGVYTQYMAGKTKTPSGVMPDIAQPTQAINRLAGRVINGFADLTKHLGAKPDDGRSLYAQKFGQTGQAAYSFTPFCLADGWVKEVSSKGLVFEIYDEMANSNGIHSRILVGEYLQEGEKPMPIVAEIYFANAVEGLAITNIIVVVSTQDCGDTCRTNFFSLLATSLKAFPATHIKRLVTRGKGKLNVLTVNEFGNLSSAVSEVSTIDEQTLMVTYAPLDVSVGGITNQADAIQALAISRLVLNKGRSVLITGALGVGKTSFVKQVLAGLHENVHAFLVNADTLAILSGPAGKNFILNEAKKRKQGDVEPHFILVVDEAHQMTEEDSSMITALLAMADGLESDALKISILLSSNDKSVMDPAILRANRFQAKVHINKLPIAQAESAFTFIKEGLEGFVLDQMAKDKVMTKTEVSLADIYQCFQRNDIAEAIALLRAIPGSAPTPMA